MSDDAFTLSGPVAPPMANGEVVFEAPWQGRVFGMARSLCEQGLYDWDDFRDRLIGEIQRNTDASDYQYFDHFLAALVSLLAERSLVGDDELFLLEQALHERPHGHDHHH